MSAPTPFVIRKFALLAASACWTFSGFAPAFAQDAEEPEKPPAEETAADETRNDDAEAKSGEDPADEAPEDEGAAEDAESERAAVARPVSADPVQVYGWRERIRINGIEDPMVAKLDTGALTSSIHAEDKEMFERDGRKWVRFIVTDPRAKEPVRTRLEAPLVRVARIKEPGGESVSREVVRLSFEIGDRKLRGEFTLNNRDNMINPVLIGRSTIKELGWVDSGRTYLADEKIFR